MIELATLFLGNQPKTDDRSYEDIFVDRYLAFNEGTEPHDSLEDDSVTGAYGIKFPNPKYKEFGARKQAMLMARDDVDLIKKQIGEKNWEALPKEVKLGASDMFWNSRSLFKNFKSKLIQGDAQGALYETLDVITGESKKTKGKVVYPGHATRRARNHNEWAKRNNKPLFETVVVKKTEDGGTKAIYNFDDGSKPVIKKSKKPLHPDSKYDIEYPVRKYDN